MPKTKVSGKFVDGFVSSAGEVSPIFEKKIREYFAQRGIDSIEPDQWYPFEKFAGAVNDVEDDVGEQTSQNAGAEMVDLNPAINDLDKLEAILDNLKKANQEAYRNFSLEEAGQFRYGTTEDGGYRMAVYGGWQHPPAFTEGFFKRCVGRSEDYDKSNLEPTDTKSDEVFAFKVTG
jgi:hypothetical protein